MIVYTAVDYGDSKIYLKQQIGEFVRRLYREGSPRNPERFVDLTYKISRNKNPERTEKYMIVVKLYHMEVSDSKYKIKQKMWKYYKAVDEDYLNWWEQRKIYGAKPKEHEKEIKI